jgi:hypothetical protein
MQKAIVVWLAVIVGSMVGCSCHHVQHCEVGPCDLGTGQPCSATMPCPSGQSCVANVCVSGGPCSDTMPCPSGQYCSGGACTSDCSPTVPCQGGAVCNAMGQCVGGACAVSPPLTGCGDPCSATMSCPPGLYCGPGMTCTADCSAAVACPAGEICSSDGHCVSGHDSSVCSSAGAPAGCGNVCTATLPCPHGLFCLGGMCTAECTSSIPCPSGQMCSSDGHCVALGADAGVGDCIDPSSGSPNPFRYQHCGGSGCIDLLEDPANCGTCNHACLPSQVCAHGTCASTCPAPTTNCNRACVDLTTDRNHCGSCATACPNNLLCISSACGCPTQFHQTECSMTCVDTANNRTNCASCGHVCTTTCASHPDTCAHQGIVCGAAGDGCGNRIGCAACPIAGDTCGGGGVQGVCGHGATCSPRTIAECLPGYCGPMDDGCGSVVNCPTQCTGIDTCGGGGALHYCGHPICMGSTCMDMCPSGYTNCSDVCIDTSANIANCGGCGIRCGAEGDCNGGSCQCHGAPPAGMDMGALANGCAPNGCSYCPGPGCVNFQTDSMNCGSCGNVCAHGCAQGACIP